MTVVLRSSHLARLCALICFLTSADALATQRLQLRFNSGAINYTPQIRADVVAGIQAIYDRFDVEVSETIPAAPFSRVTFNSGSPGGVAQKIDFRNLDPSDTAVVNVNGLGLNPSQYTGASITIGAHEFGHLFGFRHGDSFGPIGSGIGSTGPGSGAYLPTFPGPSGGNEIVNTVMGTPAIGVPLQTVSNQHWLSERSATKAQFSLTGTVINEVPGPKSTLATAQTIALNNMTVPNTIVSGDNAGPNDFSVDAIDVIGTLGLGGEIDMYRFQASAGDLFNIEVISSVIGHRIGNTLDTQISVLDSNGALINYWGSSAFNDDEFETTDAILIDLTIPSDGTYYMKVNAFSASDTGTYELYAYRFNGESTISGDFDGDGDYACPDVDALVGEIVAGTNSSSFDLTGDGLVNHDDLDAWLAEAGAAELMSGNPYLYGDANLDGFVDGSDFIDWNNNHFSSTAEWCAGDFNADGLVDGLDFIIWNDNRFTAADGFQAVPEPTGFVWALLGMMVLLKRK
jgi:hypothetical protein